MEAVDTVIAMCQIFCLDGDLAGNLLRIENAVIEAKSKGAQIACLPETALYGWVNPEAHKRADTIPGRDSDVLCALAKKHGLYLCVGIAEKEGNKLYDSVILINNSGELLLKHRKINTLTELLDPPYTRGTEVKVVDSPFGRIGLLICADTFSIPLLEKMAALKPDLLLVPYGWAEEEDNWPDHGKNLEDVVVNAAKMTGAATVGVDLVGTISHGPWRGRVYGGHSVASATDGIILGRGKDRDQDVVIVTLPSK